MSQSPMMQSDVKICAQSMGCLLRASQASLRSFRCTPTSLTLLGFLLVICLGTLPPFVLEP